ncbi:hypothetical protein QAD02_004950 [Eretmocerus hayati]|uniref:Uncharacterized protein n=1 Tax=Eretmocerus hayati TaxID=131215 RepID=A0ACC2NR65_9HYME|nr:hypothetical protein QAD02_004950 [Eretmocerus hayati]
MNPDDSNLCFSDVEMPSVAAKYALPKAPNLSPHSSRRRRSVVNPDSPMKIELLPDNTNQYFEALRKDMDHIRGSLDNSTAVGVKIDNVAKLLTHLTFNMKQLVVEVRKANVAIVEIEGTQDSIFGRLGTIVSVTPPQPHPATVTSAIEHTPLKSSEPTNQVSMTQMEKVIVEMQT